MITLDMLRELRGDNNRGFFGGGGGGGGGWDTGYQEAMDDMVELAGMDGGNYDADTAGPRLVKALARHRENKGFRLDNRANAVRGRGQGGNDPVAQVANAVQQQQVEAAAKREINKKKYKLFRNIPLFAPQVIANAGTAVIAVTPTSQSFGVNMVALGTYRIDTLSFNGASFLPNGAISSAMYQNISLANANINIYLDTVPITGGITNNTGASIYAALDLFVWSKDSAASEQY